MFFRLNSLHFVLHSFCFLRFNSVLSHGGCFDGFCPVPLEGLFLLELNFESPRDFREVEHGVIFEWFEEGYDLVLGDVSGSPWELDGPDFLRERAAERGRGLVWVCEEEDGFVWGLLFDGSGLCSDEVWVS